MVNRREREAKMSERPLECDIMGKDSLGDNAEWRLLINAEAMDNE